MTNNEDPEKEGCKSKKGERKRKISIELGQEVSWCRARIACGQADTMVGPEVNQGRMSRYCIKADNMSCSS